MKSNLKIMNILLVRFKIIIIFQDKIKNLQRIYKHYKFLFILKMIPKKCDLLG
jgi:hypothetical protein